MEIPRSSSCSKYKSITTDRVFLMRYRHFQRASARILFVLTIVLVCREEIFSQTLAIPEGETAYPSQQESENGFRPPIPDALTIPVDSTSESNRKSHIESGFQLPIKSHKTFRLNGALPSSSQEISLPTHPLPEVIPSSTQQKFRAEASFSIPVKPEVPRNLPSPETSTFKASSPAQPQLTLPAPSTPVPQPQTYSTPQTVGTQNTNVTQLPTGGTIQFPDYWVISTRHCDRRFGQDQGCSVQFSHRYRNWLQPGNQQSFIASLKPGVPLCIHIHGSFISPQQAQLESMTTYYWLRNAMPNQPVQFAFFTWPSDPLPLALLRLNVELLGNRAEYHGAYLGRLLASIPPTTPICLLGHSHGVRTASSAVQVLTGGQIQGHFIGNQHRNRRIRIVAISAAVDHTWYNPNQRFNRVLHHVESFLNVQNRKDIALNLYPLRNLASHRALGDVGFTPRDRSQLGFLGYRAIDYDVSRLIRHHHTMEHYRQYPALASALRNHIYFLQ